MTFMLFCNLFLSSTYVALSNVTLFPRVLVVCLAREAVLVLLALL